MVTPARRAERFWAQVDRAANPDECWPWIGWRDKQGYGRFGRSGAYRVAYEFLVGPIPPGLEIDHLCRNTSCVNPRHLEPVTREENARRVAQSRTACRSGHAWTPENTRLDSTGARVCRACIRRNGAKYRQRKRMSAA